MRLLVSSALALLLVCESASADVFVPADPSGVARNECAVGERDVFAVGGVSAIRVQVGSGAFTQLSALTGCPMVAAAVDGTAAVLGRGGWLAVRRPGEAFSARRLQAYPQKNALRYVTIAVAPGGWAVATWSDGSAVNAEIVRPDGTSTTTLVGRGTSVDTGPVGIDADGNVTAIWRRSGRRFSHVLVARFSTGSPAASSVIPDTDPYAEKLVALSVTPRGDSLLAWAAIDGMHVSLNGGPPVTVDATSPLADALGASLADDGTALLAYLSADGELVTVQRRGGNWTAPRVLWSAGDDYNSGAYSIASGGGDDAKSVRTTIGVDGRSAAAWSAPEDGAAQVFGAVAATDGAWGSTVRLSSIARATELVSLASDATGVPRALWSEVGAGMRGATVATTQADRTAPVVATSFPSRLPRTRTARVRFDARVRCSEACDALLTVEPPKNATALESGYVRLVRALPEGKTRVLRVRIAGASAREIRDIPGARTLRVRLVISDRAGNLYRQNRTLRVRLAA